MSAAIVAALCASCSCKPKVETFTVKPQGYCSMTQAIHVQWKTKRGGTTLQVTPPDETPRPVASRGSLDLEPHDMTITLEVRSGDRHDARRVEVRAIGARPLNGLALTCDDGWVTTEPATFGGDAPFDPNAHLSVISNKCAADAGPHATCRRNVEVIRGTDTWTLGPDSVRDVSADKIQLTGQWKLRQQLLPDEECNSPSAQDATEVQLSIEINCGEDEVP